KGMPAPMRRPTPMPLPTLPSRPAAPAEERVTLSVEGMHCASCVQTIETALSQVRGVDEALVNLGTGRADVRGHGLEPTRLIQAVQETGYDARLLAETTPDEQSRRAEEETRKLRNRTLASAALTAPVLVLSMADVHFPGRDLVQLVLTL